MKVTYDPMADAMYIYFSYNKKSSRTEEVSTDITVDYAGDALVGIEILNVSKKLPKKELEQVSFNLPTYRGKIASVTK